MITFRPCTLQHLTHILELQETAFLHLDDPTLLRRNTSEMFASCLSDPHVTFGAFDKEKLVAIAIFYVPSTPEEDLSTSLQNQHNLPSANYKLCIVHPDYRGNRLQITLGEEIIEYARQQGYRLLCATASPLNIASHKNLIHLGFTLDSQSTHYGFERNVYYHEID